VRGSKREWWGDARWKKGGVGEGGGEGEKGGEGGVAGRGECEGGGRKEMRRRGGESWVQGEGRKGRE